MDKIIQKKPGRKPTKNRNNLNILLSDEMLEEIKKQYPDFPVVIVIRLALKAFLKI